YHFDRSIIITANEQEQYQAVVQKCLEQFAPELVKASTHLTHGMVRLKGGVKMSSRLGNFLRATDVLDSAREANTKLSGKENREIVLGAVKYAFLKTRTGGDVVYDPDESVSIEGNSGPYLQYAFARASSILAKAPNNDLTLQPTSMGDGEKLLVRKLTRFNETVASATAEYLPH